jgi:phosphotransferase system  glucose/maltose/N-acetylglucosamine-specific IIC component
LFEEILPAPEFWISGNALIAAVAFLFATGLAVLGIKQHGRPLYFAAVIGLAIITAAVWWNLARQEEAKAKSDTDYVYLVPNQDARDHLSDGRIGLLSVPSGVVRNVTVAIQLTEDREKASWNYLYANKFDYFDVGENRTGIFLQSKQLCDRSRPSD